MEKLRNLKVKKRLMYSFIGTVILSSIAGLLGIILLLVMDTKYSTALIENGFIQGDLGSYNSYLNKSGAFVRDIIMLTDEEEIASAKASLEDSDAKADYFLSEFTSKLENDDEQALLAIITEQYPKYIALRDEAIALAEQNKNEEALEMFRKEAIPYLQEIMAAADELLTMNIEMGDNKSDSLTALSRILIIIMIVILVVAIVISSKFAVYTAKDFSAPIEKMETAIQLLANGELDASINDDSQNELGKMTRHFSKAVAMLHSYIECIEYGLTEIGNGNFTVRPNVEFSGEFIKIKESIEVIITSLNQTLKQIDEGSEQVLMGSEQLAESAQALAEGATTQASAIQELTATIESVANAAEDSAQKADEANKTAEHFADLAEESSHEMGLLTEAMQRITQTSKEIENIIAEIENIASQTNLLSLNASIEAARAGEAGKGFAVVADQIGKLAADSAQSAVSTKELIVKSLDEIVKGNEIAIKTADALAEVIDGIRLLAAASKQTSTLSSEQAATMAQVLDAIEQIAEVVQNNSAAAEETSATSEELSAQSQTLKSLVEHFTLIED